MQSFFDYMQKREINLPDFWNTTGLFQDETNNIHKWCKKNTLTRDMPIPLRSEDIPEGVSYPKSWELNLFYIWQSCTMMDMYFDKNDPVMAATLKKGRKYYSDISSLAKKLASVIDSHSASFSAMKIIIDMQIKEGKMPEEMRLNHNFSKALRGLSQISEEQALLFDNIPWQDKRPSTGNPKARALARKLAGFLDANYSRTPNGLIASCVILTYPDLDPPPNEDTIRKWRGVK